MNDTPDDARAFGRKYGWEFPIIDDQDRSEAGKLGIAGHPAVILVDENGGIVGGFYGEGDPASWDELAAGL